MTNHSRRKRRWLRWCRYANHYMADGLSVGKIRGGVRRMWDWSAARRWPWP